MKDFFNLIPEGYTFDDVLLVPSLSDIKTRSNVDLSSKFLGKIECSGPIIPANMSTIVEEEMASSIGALGYPVAFHRFLSPKDIVIKYKRSVECFGIGYCPKEKLGISIGVNKKWYDDVFREFMEEGINDLPFIIIDIAHGHHSLVQETIEDIKKYQKYFGFSILAGNVCTPEGAEYLAKLGVDGIKVGIGGGSICSTRIVTSCGYPQLSAIKNISEIIRVRYPKITIVADGGIRNSGDIVKSLAAGADFIMAGNLFSGAEETPGETVIIDGKCKKKYSGMASDDAMTIFFGEKRKTAEGETVFVDPKGKVYEILENIIGGVKSGFSYCGCDNIEELHDYGKMTSSWVKVSPATQVENIPHAMLKGK